MMKRLIAVLFCSVMLAACERVLMPKPKSDKPVEVFEHMWKTIEEGYAHFGYRVVNWDSAYKEFRPKISDTMSERQLFDTCAAMLSWLTDPDVALKTSFAEYHYTDTTYYLANFNRRLLER